MQMEISLRKLEREAEELRRTEHKLRMQAEELRMICQKMKTSKDECISQIGFQLTKQLELLETKCVCISVFRKTIQKISMLYRQTEDSIVDSVDMREKISPAECKKVSLEVLHEVVKELF